eukprot:2406028-Amphidinium_carterae.1
MGGMHYTNITIQFLMLFMARARPHPRRVWTLAFSFNSFNSWLAPHFVSLLGSQVAADNDNNNQQQQLPHNYTYIATTLSTATPFSTMDNLPHIVEFDTD